MPQSSNKEIMKLIGDIHRGMRRSHAAIHCDLKDITLLQLHTIGIVYDRKRVRMGELSEALGIAKASVTALVRRLVSSGWLMREMQGDDRRMVYLRLTPHGRMSFRKLRDRKARTFESIIDGLGPTNKKQLLFILRELKNQF